MTIVIAIAIFIIGDIAATISDTNIGTIEEELVYDDPLDLFIFVPLIVGFLAIMILILVVFKGLRSSNNTMTQEIEGIEKRISTLKTKIAKECNLPTIIGNFHFSGLYNVDDAMEKARTYRDIGYRVKLKNFLGEDNVRITGDEICGVYVSDWPKDEEIDKGKPEWMDN